MMAAMGCGCLLFCFLINEEVFFGSGISIDFLLDLLGVMNQKKNFVASTAAKVVWDVQSGLYLLVHQQIGDWVSNLALNLLHIRQAEGTGRSNS